MVHIAKSFPALLSFSVLVLADVNSLKGELTTVGEDLKTLDTQLNNLPDQGGNAVAVLVIEGTLKQLIHDIDTANDDAKATPPFNIQDGTTIVNALNGLPSSTMKTLDDLVAKKEAFKNVQGIDFTPMVRQDLKDLNNATITFADNLIVIMPSSLQGNVADLRDSVEGSLNATMAAFA